MPVLSGVLQAQECQPDPAYADSTGVFPLPYDETIYPDGGIKDCAYIGQPFNYTFTVGVGDSINVVIGGFALSLPLDSVVVVSVTGLPVGINYACDKPGCKFAKNSIGCAVLYGTPTAANAPGDYQLVITGRAYFAPPAFPPFFDVAFPGDFFPGEYKLKLLANSSDPCEAVNTRESLRGSVSMSVNPNPASGEAQLVIDSKINGNFTLHIVDLLGQTNHQQKAELFTGMNTIRLDGSHLPNGLYMVMLENEKGHHIAQKLTIQH
jgi:hypothetical protein